MTLAVFQLPMGWLNDSARANMPLVLVTLAVFQLEMFWLNDVAL